MQSKPSILRWAAALAAMLLVALTAAWFSTASPASKSPAAASAVTPDAQGLSWLATTPPAALSAPAPRAERPPAADHPDADCLARQEALPAAERGWPPALEPWARLLAQRLSSSGDPMLMALGLSVGDPERRDATVWLGQLHTVARAAILSADPVLYGLALEGCAQRPQGAVEADSPCGQLGHEQLSRLAPDHALTWLARSARERRRDPAASLDALYRASVAPRRESLDVQALRRLVQYLPDDMPGWARYTLTERWMRQRRFTAEADVHEAASMAEVCDDAHRDANLRELCDALARNLLSDGASARALWSGLMVAETLQWSDQRLAPFRQRAWLRHRARTMMPVASEAVCGDVDHGLVLLRALLDPEALPLLQTDDVRASMERRQARRDDANRRWFEAHPADPPSPTDTEASEASE